MTPSSSSSLRRMTWIKWLALGVAGVGLASWCLLPPCPQMVRDGEGWTRSAYSLQQIGRALHDYQDVFGQLPPVAITTKDGKPLHSWRVALLPFLEHNYLYKQLQLDEPWDSPHNKPLLEKTLRYEPGGPDAPGLTRYQVFVGPGTAFERDGLTWADFPDGLANTILVVEAGEPVPWAKPTDLAYAPDKPLPPLGGPFTKPVHFLCYEIKRAGGFNACFADGTTRFIRSTTDEATIRALITRNGGEQVDVSKLE